MSGLAPGPRATAAGGASAGLSDRWLFWIPALIWASTWHVILYQFGPVPSINSVAYRFALAALALFAIAAWRRESSRFGTRDHATLALTGALQYGLNYWCVYVAEAHVPSGLVAVLFSLMVFGNAFIGAIFFSHRVTRALVLGGALGVLGVALIFWPEIASARARPTAHLGLAAGLAAVAFALAGNLLTLKLRERGAPLMPTLAWSMGYGSALLLLIAGATGVGFAFDTRWTYLASLVYLSAFGSVVAFVLYFKLAQRQGPARASLMAIVIPVIALAVSAALEGWRPSVVSIAGIACALAGLRVATRPAD